MDFSIINQENYSSVIEYIKTFSDEKYREFHKKLIPNEDITLLGIRVPVLRKLAKEIVKGDYSGFLRCAGKVYYEECMLRGMVIGLLKTDFDTALKNLNDFIPYISNWAVCDTFCTGFKIVQKYKADFFDCIVGYSQCENQWAVRTALVLMLSHYIDEEYVDRVLECCARVNRDEYYIMMAKAWVLSVVYAKFPEKGREFILNNQLDRVTLKNTIQKCVDSYRISNEEKAFLKTLRKRL